MLIIFSWCIGDVIKLKCYATLVCLCLIYVVEIPILLRNILSSSSLADWNINNLFEQWPMNQTQNKLGQDIVIFCCIYVSYLRQPMPLFHFIIDAIPESIRISKSWPKAHCKCNWLKLWLSVLFLWFILWLRQI